MDEQINRQLGPLIKYISMKSLSIQISFWCCKGKTTLDMADEGHF